ncbi:hypothetical protein F5Y18DRAFT_431442 [Xylariaceae sp. FL1019]|nr:hypothetical protein F5Y18DRAFT_431442 [Xylariaceae sp. FL1019]
MADEVPPPHAPSFPSQSPEAGDSPHPGRTGLATDEKDQKVEDETESANDVGNHNANSDDGVDETSPMNSDEIQIEDGAKFEAECDDGKEEDKHGLPFTVDVFPLTPFSTSTQHNPPKSPTQEIVDFITRLTIGVTPRDLNNINDGEAASSTPLDRQNRSEGEDGSRDDDANTSFPVLMEFTPRGMVLHASRPAVALMQSQDILLTTPPELFPMFSGRSESLSPEARQDDEDEAKTETEQDLGDEIERDEYGFPLVWDSPSSPRRSSVSPTEQQEASVDFLKTWHDNDETVPFGPIRDDTADADENTTNAVWNGNVEVVPPEIKLTRRTPEGITSAIEVIKAQNVESELTVSPVSSLLPESSGKLATRVEPRQDPANEQGQMQTREQESSRSATTPQDSPQPLKATCNRRLCSTPEPSAHDSHATKDGVTLPQLSREPIKDRLLGKLIPSICKEFLSLIKISLSLLAKEAAKPPGEDIELSICKKFLSAIEISLSLLGQVQESIRPPGKDINVPSPGSQSRDLLLRAYQHSSPRSRTLEPRSNFGEETSSPLEGQNSTSREDGNNPTMPCPDCGPEAQASDAAHLHYPSSSSDSEGAVDSPVSEPYKNHGILKQRQLLLRRQIVNWDPTSPPQVRAQSPVLDPVPKDIYFDYWPRPAYMRDLPETTQLHELCRIINHLQKDIVFLNGKHRVKKDKIASLKREVKDLERQLEEQCASTYNPQLEEGHASNLNLYSQQEEEHTSNLAPQPNPEPYLSQSLPQPSLSQSLLTTIITTLTTLLKTVITCILYAILLSIALRCMNSLFPITPNHPAIHPSINPTTISAIPNPPPRLSTIATTTLPTTVTEIETETETETETVTVISTATQTVPIPSPSSTTQTLSETLRDAQSRAQNLTDWIWSIAGYHAGGQ